MLRQGVAKTLYYNRLFFVFSKKALKVEKNLSENASDMLVQSHAGSGFDGLPHSVRHLSTEACVVPLESLLHTLLIDGVRSFTRGVEAAKHQQEKHCQRQVWWSSKTLNSARLAARARPGHILQDAAHLNQYFSSCRHPNCRFWARLRPA